MTANPKPVNAMTTPLVAATLEPATVSAADLTPAVSRPSPGH